MSDFGAVVLAGGAARRMGGRAKPALRVGATTLLTRVLAAVPTADPVVVVGPPDLDELLPARVSRTREDPPGGGPVAAAHAGLSFIARTPGSSAVVALLAADLPFLSAEVVDRLRDELRDQTVDGAVLIDEANRPQWLCGVWRRGPLAGRIAAAAPGASLRGTVGVLRIRTVGGAGRAWFDCDTDEDLRTAQEWDHAEPR